MTDFDYVEYGEFEESVAGKIPTRGGGVAMLFVGVSGRRFIGDPKWRGCAKRSGDPL